MPDLETPNDGSVSRSEYSDAFTYYFDPSDEQDLDSHQTVVIEWDTHLINHQTTAVETVITGDDIPPVGLISPGTYSACQLAVQGEDVLDYLRNLDETELDNDFTPDIVPDNLRTKYTSTLPGTASLSTLEKYFAFRPHDVIWNTLRRTIQLAKAVIRYPLRRHLKSRFPMLRRPRLNEVVATDTYFSNVKSIEGYHCAQVFFGCTLKLLHVEGMKTES